MAQAAELGKAWASRSGVMRDMARARLALAGLTNMAVHHREVIGRIDWGKRPEAAAKPHGRLDGGQTNDAANGPEQAQTGAATKTTRTTEMSQVRRGGGASAVTRLAPQRDDGAVSQRVPDAGTISPRPILRVTLVERADRENVRQAAIKYAATAGRQPTRSPLAGPSAARDGQQIVAAGRVAPAADGRPGVMVTEDSARPYPATGQGAGRRAGIARSVAVATPQPAPVPGWAPAVRMAARATGAPALGSGAVERASPARAADAVTARQAVAPPGVGLPRMAVAGEAAPEAGRAGLPPQAAAELGTAGAPAPQGGAGAGAAPTQGDVYLDGALMGRWMARALAADAARPASGSAGFDPRRSAYPAGAMIGG